MTVAALLTVEQVPIDQLRPDPANPRRISDEELDALERSLRQFGFVQPVLARTEDRTVIGGHQRLVAARRLGMATVPVTYLDLSVEQARLLGLALNRISGTWDEQLLARLVDDLQASPEVDLSLSGFAEDEVHDLLRSLQTREKKEQTEDFDLDSALEEATREPRTTPGELWALGEHRLLVGDATKPEEMQRLLGRARASMAFTDPPYNVSLGDHGGHRRGARRRRIANDSMDAISWEAFVRAWSRTLLSWVDGALYVCMSSKEMPLVSRVLAEEGGHWSDTIIWHKDRFVLGRADYQRAYEPIWFGWREGASHHWCGNRDQDDVWEIDRPSDAPLHPTMKPLPLMERAIANSSLAGDLVLDLFAGSGSTLIACERTGRRCAALELDPAMPTWCWPAGSASAARPQSRSMARAMPQLSPGTATGAPVGRKRSGSANAPTRRRRGARAELIRQLDRVLEGAPELTRRHMDWQWAIRYLETARGFKPPPPPMSQADRIKLAEGQADEMAGVVRSVLDGLNLSDADFERGIDLAIEALRAASAQGWEPL